MDARGTMGMSIGDVATSAHLQNGIPNKIALAAAKSSATVTGDGAAAPNAPAAVSSGSTGITRRGIPLNIVLSGLQPSAPMASPSH